MILRIVGYLFGIGAVLFLAVAAGVGWYVSGLTHDLPDYDVLAKYEPPVMTRVHAADGQLVAEYAHERRLYLPIQAVPDRVKDAFISAEDKNFYQHSGLDYYGILRAIVTNLQHYSEDSQHLVGASTITQQVAKNFLLSNEQTIDRKVTEAILALRIEQAYSKDKILELYLNEIYLGVGAYGVAAASLAYFDKSVHELTLAEAAYLAALPKAPNNYNPFRHYDRAVDRRNWVIDRMVENGYVSAADGEAAKQEPLTIRQRATKPSVFAADYFVEEVRRELSDMYGENTLYEGGLSVRTSLEPAVQVMARKALMDGLVKFDEEHGWRGPVAHIDDLGDDWGPQLADIPALSDVIEWRLAVVLSLGPDAAAIGLQPGHETGTNAVKPERDTGTIPLDQMKWAKWATGKKKGAAVKAPGDVLNVGDVVYVEAADTTKPGEYQLRQVPEIEGGLVAMDPHTGRVVAMVGGFSFDASQFNRATQAYRQPGSSFKPFVYSAALDNGYTPSSVVMDAPIEIDQGPGLPTWSPENYSNKYYGPSTLRTGIEQSRNVMTVRLAQDMGMPLVAEYARRFGVVDNLQPVLSMALGAGETTVLRMTAGFAVFANGGREVRPTLIDRIQDRFGKTIYRHDERICEGCNADSWHGQDEPTIVDNSSQVLDPMTAYQMTSMLEGVVKRGTGTVAQAIGKPVAGKTGTTNDYHDAWFMGFSPDLVAGVYVGYDQPHSLGRSSTGGGLAAPIFTEFMEMALADKPPVPFRVPPGMNFIPIDRRTGLRAQAGDPDTILEAFKPGTAPPDTYSIIGYTDAMGRPLTVAPETDRAVISGTGGLY